MTEGMSAVLARMDAIRSAFGSRKAEWWSAMASSAAAPAAKQTGSSFDDLLRTASTSTDRSSSSAGTGAGSAAAGASSSGALALDRLGLASKGKTTARTEPWPEGLPAAARQYEEEFRAAAEATGVPLQILLAVAWAESAFRAGAVSPAGALGLMQLMPGTAAGLGVDPGDPAQNILGGARYLATQYETFGSWELAFAAYNAGPGAVQQYGGVPPYSETRNYIATITDYLDRLGTSTTPTLAPASAPAGAVETAAPTTEPSVTAPAPSVGRPPEAAAAPIAPTTPAAQAPGADAAGSTAAGSTSPGSTAAGSTAPGSTAPGSTAAGSNPLSAGPVATDAFGAPGATSTVAGTASPISPTPESPAAPVTGAELAASAGGGSTGAGAPAPHARPTASDVAPTFPFTVAGLGSAAATAAATTAATTTAPVLPAQVGQQLLGELQRLRAEGGGAQRLVLRLDPPELGAVRLHFELRGGDVYVILRPERPDAAPLLQEQRDRVAAILQREGMNLSGFDVRSGDQQSERHRLWRTPERASRVDLVDGLLPTPSTTRLPDGLRL